MFTILSNKIKEKKEKKKKNTIKIIYLELVSSDLFLGKGLLTLLLFMYLKEQSQPTMNYFYTNLTSIDKILIWRRSTIFLFVKLVNNKSILLEIMVHINFTKKSCYQLNRVLMYGNILFRRLFGSKMYCWIHAKFHIPLPIITMSVWLKLHPECSR